MPQGHGRTCRSVLAEQHRTRDQGTPHLGLKFALPVAAGGEKNRDGAKFLKHICLHLPRFLYYRGRVLCYATAKVRRTRGQRLTMFPYLLFSVCEVVLPKFKINATATGFQILSSKCSKCHCRLAADPAVRAYSALSDLWLYLRGHTSKRKRRQEKRRKMKKR